MEVTKGRNCHEDAQLSRFHSGLHPNQSWLTVLAAMAQAIPDGSTIWIKDKHSAESFVKSTVRHGPGITDTVTHKSLAHVLHMRLHTCCTFAARSLHVRCTFAAHASRQVLPAWPRVHRDDARWSGEDAAAGGRFDGQPHRDGAA